MAVTNGGGSDIVVVDLGSRASRRLTDSGAINVSPCYSPDGIADRVQLRPRRRPAALHHGCGRRRGEADQLRQRALRDAGLVAARRPDRLHPVRRGRGQLLDRRDAPGRQRRAHPGGGLGRRRSDLRAERPGDDVLARDAGAGRPRRAGIPSRLVSVDITGFNERVAPTPTDASDPAWSPLAA